MTKQTIFSILTIIIVAIALFFGIRAFNESKVPPLFNDELPHMGKLPAGSPLPPKTSDIMGQTWVWEKNIIGGDGVVPVTKPGKFSITFGKDGRVSGTTDCNGFGGEYTIGSDGIISFGPFMSTLMYCEGSQEADFTSSLAQATRMTMDADGNLTLILGDTSNVMVLSKKSIEMCYQYSKKQPSGFYDKAILKMNLTGTGGTKVTGEYKNLPAEKDSKVGTFTGTVGPMDPKISARTADVWWNSMAEGMTVTEQLKIVFGEGSAVAQFGEMVDRGDGVYVYKNTKQLTSGFQMSQVDCTTL